MGLFGVALGQGPYGLTEEGSKALLLAWSVGDHVASAVLTLGAPDIRLLLFLPLGFLWSGKVLAAKLATLSIMTAAGVGLYRWRACADQAEPALLATGLLLIAPLTLSSIDSLSASPVLLAVVAFASPVNRKLAGEAGTLGGWFFTQLLLCAATVSLHPAGLAYPAILVFFWLSQPTERRERQYALIGIPLTAVLVLVMRGGWPDVMWGQNPLPSVAAIFAVEPLFDRLSSSAGFGAVAFIALTAMVGIHERQRLFADLTGGMLLVGVLLGAVSADRTWAHLLLALLLYGGLPWALRACAPLSRYGWMAQRGWLWLILVGVCTWFMSVDRYDYFARREGLLSSHDELIKRFADGMDVLQTGSHHGTEAALLVASPWPARTSIACKCAALPLPPATIDSLTQLAIMRGIEYVILSDSVNNRALANNFSQLGSGVEVVSKQVGGVILHLKPARVDL